MTAVPCLFLPVCADDPPPAAETNAVEKPAPPSLAECLAKLRDEGTNRSQINEIFTYLTDVVGPRLTASPGARRANEWTRDKLASWGLTNAHLEPWGPFGRGWSVKRFSAQVIDPQCIPLIAWPKAWSHGSEWPIVGDLVYLDARSEADLEAYKGKLKGCVVLVSAPRDIAFRFEPSPVRLTDAELLRMANAEPAARRAPRRPPPGDFRRPSPTNAPAARPQAGNRGDVRPPSTNAPAPPRRRPSFGFSSMDKLRFAVHEGAAATVSISTSDEFGALMVGSATPVYPQGAEPERPSFGGGSPWATNAPAGPPQIVLAAEHYNRLVSMIRNGEKPKVALEVQTQFHDQDLMCYNTIAEIPGTDRHREIVMLGAHIDSAPGGTGATDNAAGVAVCMEAVRLIRSLELPPRRTIRIGIWTGEEQGLHGSRAYVTRHFGYYTNRNDDGVLRSPRDGGRQRSDSRAADNRKLVRQREYNRFSAYFNLDNGAGRIRGIYLQGNEALRPVFRQWLGPLRELGAETVTVSNTHGTDHLSFDAIGLPGFQFIQDPVEYFRSYHTTMDVRPRAPVKDLEQAAVVMATFVYQTAMMDEKLPRKPKPPTP